jgi:D-tyrosyl-tRNA(Tyr) deacylase
MRAVVQRVSEASVAVDGQIVGRIGPGLVVLVGVARGDGPDDADTLADKLSGLRIFADPEGRMNLALEDVGGSLLVVSQFTLLADVRRGRRPAFTEAADPAQADQLIRRLVDRLSGRGFDVATGRFGAKMSVSLVNDGPVTIVLEVVDGQVQPCGPARRGPAASG